jgi:hypothetical protein
MTETIEIKSTEMETSSVPEMAEDQKSEPTSQQAKERAAIVLEVLAGTLQVSEASEKLQINAPAYYNLEARALQGLVKGCESRAKGPGINYRKQIRELEEQNRKLEREARRYQSLTRAAQKAIGLMEIRQESPASGNGTGKKPKKRTPRKVRAQRAAERLRGKTRKKTSPKTTPSLQKAGSQ